MKLSAEIIRAIASGQHGDPFAVLGPHRDGQGRATIRAFLPEAREVSVVAPGGDGRTHAMKALHPAGLWAATVPEQVADAYRLRVVDQGGHVREIEDPYRFASTLSGYDLHLLSEGTHYRVYDKLGAHPARVEEIDGVIFAVWAPNAKRVSVVGDWNGWDGRCHPMRLHPGNGIWELFVPGVTEGARYKYEIIARSGEPLALKADPFAFAFEPDTPRTASVVHRLDGYEWQDADWMAERRRRPAHTSPDVHLRGAPRVVAPRARGRRPLPRLPRAGRAARRLRDGDGVHPRRAPARHRASVLRVVGLSDHRVLRAHPPLRYARTISWPSSTTCTGAASA